MNRGPSTTGGDACSFRATPASGRSSAPIAAAAPLAATPRVPRTAAAMHEFPLHVVARTVAAPPGAAPLAAVPDRARPDRSEPRARGRASAAGLPRHVAFGVSWLGTLVVQAGALVAPSNGLAAQANASAAPAPATAIHAVLAELDAAFARGDTAGYLARFAPDHPSAHACLQRRLAQTFARTTSRQRATTIVGEPRAIGDHTAVHVRHEIELRGAADAAVGATRFTEDFVLALRRGANGELVPTLAVESAPVSRCVAADVFRCPPCNLAVGGVPGWLCVVLRQDRANALEAASFFLLGTDIVCDVSVQVDAERRAPVVVAQQLADTLHRLEPDAALGVAAPWLPPALAAAPPAGVSGASVAIDVRPRGASPGRAIFHVAAFGGLQHLLLLRGSAAALRDHAPAVDQLLASYRLVEPQRDVAAAMQQPLEHHTGGVLVGDTYHNHRFGVELPGAPGWRAVMLTGGAAFRVVWTSPQRSRLWLSGYAVPPGMSRWCRTTASRWLEQQCEHRGLELWPDAAESTAWSDDAACGGTSRTLVGTARETQSPEQSGRRWFRLLLREDLLLVVDGFATTAADEAALQRMLQAIQRR